MTAVAPAEWRRQMWPKEVERVPQLPPVITLLMKITGLVWILFGTSITSANTCGLRAVILKAVAPDLHLGTYKKCQFSGSSHTH